MDGTFKSLGAKVFSNMEKLVNLLKIH